MALILGGALGNLVDRLRTGQVIDFINVGIGPHRWPVFNVADSAVTVGVIWLALGLARATPPPVPVPEEADASASASDGI